MSDIRPFPDTPRALIDYNFIEGMLGEEVLVCVPKGAYQIARDFITASGFYVGSYYTSVNDAGYHTPTDGQFDDIDSIISEFLAAEVYDMGCLEELKLSIDCLCQAIFLTQTGGGSGGAGSFPASPESFTDDGANFPSGYDDRTEYVDSKCNLSQFVIDRLSGDFDRLKQIQVAGQGALALAGIVRLLMLTPIGLSQIVGGVVTAILALAAAGIAAYVQALDELQTRIDAMDICELYEANSVTGAISNVHNWIAGGSYTLSTLTIELGQALVGTDALNVLFSPKSENINYDELPVGNCSSCVSTCGLEILTGSGPNYPGGEYSSALNTVEMVRLRPTDETCVDQSVTISGVTGTRGLIYQRPDGSIHSANISTWPHTFSVRWKTISPSLNGVLQLNAPSGALTTPFTVTIEFEEL